MLFPKYDILFVEDTLFQIKLVVAETVDSKGNRQSKISLFVLPEDLFVLGEICKSVNSAHIQAPFGKATIALHNLHYNKKQIYCTNLSK